MLSLPDFFVKGLLKDKEFIRSGKLRAKKYRDSLNEKGLSDLISKRRSKAGSGL